MKETKDKEKKWGGSGGGDRSRKKGGREKDTSKGACTEGGDAGGRWSVLHHAILLMVMKGRCRGGGNVPQWSWLRGCLSQGLASPLLPLLFFPFLSSLFLVFSCRLSCADSLSYYCRGVHCVGLRVIFVILHFGYVFLSWRSLWVYFGIVLLLLLLLTFIDCIYFSFLWCYSSVLLIVGLFWCVIYCEVFSSGVLLLVGWYGFCYYL